ncbi:type I restriction-modification system subunit M [Salibacter halophilus]|uniref:site-specific DNA-methyltransferase (adenine-specific) n=1 Tax=Salibacter halophilus TaxID=1803916 RepID=A0A6N6M8F2_9FLAO|nr:class I SAM-dependent DNA methyltransferase [Salibacter halophilus]KAB1065135.1 SAM-dependent DNA methyltransferase [Salibacter halophilus]
MIETESKDHFDSIENKLWRTADKLRKNMDAAEYKHVVLGLIFLKYISDAFKELHEKLQEGAGEYEGADPEDKNEYLAEKVFYVPPQARWPYLMSKAKQPSIGKEVDEAMEAIEKDNNSLKGVLPKVYARENLDKQSLGQLIDIIGTIEFMADKNTTQSSGKDLLGQVYEYFLGQFAIAEGKKGGQFYTPQSIVQLLVELIEPYEGRVFDPCCGSGGMFVQSEKFVASHADHYSASGKNNLKIDPKDRISIYGQESNQTTWRLCKMNLAIRGIDSSNVKWNTEGSFLNDAHKDLKADYILANPPFNDSDWSGDLLRTDGRWLYGVPSSSNANYAWIQHFIYHLAPSGYAAFLLSNGALSSNASGEGKIRANMIENDLVDCIVKLPTQLFYNTQISVSIWIIAKNKSDSKYRNRAGEVLFIDARSLGTLVDRTQRILTEQDISRITDAYHSFRTKSKSPKNESGFCRIATLNEIKSHNNALVPGRYVGFNKMEVEDISWDWISQEIGEINSRSEQIVKITENSVNLFKELYNG